MNKEWGSEKHASEDLRLNGKLCRMMKPAKERHDCGGSYFQTSHPPLLLFMLNMF